MSLVSVLNGHPVEPQATQVYELLVSRLKPGEVFTHEELATAAGAVKGSARYRTVVMAARNRLMREKGTVLLARNGIGLAVPDGPEQIRAGTRGCRLSVKKWRKSIGVIGMVSDDRLTDIDRRKRDHIVMTAAHVSELLRTDVKEFALTLGATNGALPWKPEVATK